jgi:predicted nucleic acid-binding protein
MIFLLDVNVLIALGDANHPHRLAALRFLESSTTVDKTLRAFASSREPLSPSA